MPRRMRDPAFRQQQHDGVHAPHVAAVNRLVDDLSNDGTGRWVPYVPPYHGGVTASVLFLLRDPGPMTDNRDGARGSGFLCSENDGSSAERLAVLMAAVGLDDDEVLGWNAYPWYINAAPTARQLEEGLEPLSRLLALLPELRVVVLLGRHAQESWRRLTRRSPELTGHLPAVATRHTSVQAFIARTPEQRAAWEAQQLRAFRSAAALAHDHPTGTT